MKLQINDHRKVFAINEEFSSEFKNLKLQFTPKSSGTKSFTSDKIVEAHQTINDCRINHNDGYLNVNGDMTAYELKHNLNNIYGLRVHVMKRQLQDWVECKYENHETLHELNLESVAQSN